VSKERRQELREKYNALIVDWESFAVAKVCEMDNVPCVVIRAVSDLADENAFRTYQENIERLSRELVKNVLKVYF